MLCFGKKVKRR